MITKCHQIVPNAVKWQITSETEIPLLMIVGDIARTVETCSKRGRYIKGSTMDSKQNPDGSDSRCVHSDDGECWVLTDDPMYQCISVDKCENGKRRKDDRDEHKLCD